MQRRPHDSRIEWKVALAALTIALAGAADDPDAPYVVFTLALAIAIVAGASVWAVYGFRYAASVEPGLALDWSVLDARPGASSEGMRLARDLRRAPEAWLHGLAEARASASRR